MALGYGNSRASICGAENETPPYSGKPSLMGTLPKVA